MSSASGAGGFASGSISALSTSASGFLPYVKFSVPIRVEMCYIWSSIKENVEKRTLFLLILAYFDAKHSNFLICCT